MIKYGRGAAAQVDHLVPARTNRGTKKLPTSPLPPITAMRTVMILAGLALRRGCCFCALPLVSPSDDERHDHHDV